MILGDFIKDIKNLPRNYVAQLPTIFFFIILFIVIVSFFGAQYAIMVSAFTTVFKVKYPKNLSINELFKLFLLEALLCFLGIIATFNIFLCVFLNISVLFILVVFQSSQFNPKGAFAYVMTFIFVQLKPLGISNFSFELFVMLICDIFLIVSLMLFSFFNKKEYSQIKNLQEGLSILSNRLLLINSGEYKRVCDELFSYSTSYQQSAYLKKSRVGKTTNKVKIDYMMAILFQRSTYLCSDLNNGDYINKFECMICIDSLSIFLNNVRIKIEENDNSILISEAKKLIKIGKFKDERIKTFYNSFLYMLILILKNVTIENRDNIKHPLTENVNKYLNRLNRKFSSKSFEVRYAIRLIFVMTLTVSLCKIFNISHLYWIPLNALLLLQPGYEESNKRMITRPIGTVIGCIIIFFIYPYLPGVTGIFILSFLMLSIMYSLTPGTWYQPIFSTVYALSMASLSMNNTTAIQMRLLYLFIAVFIVMLVNNLLFPNKKEYMFKLNINTLNDIQFMSWELIYKSLLSHIDNGMFHNALNYFHMIYMDSENYIKGMEDTNKAKKYRDILTVHWRMLSEAEQILWVIQTRSIDYNDMENLFRLADYFTHLEINDLFIDNDYLNDNFIFEDDNVNYFTRQYIININRLFEIYKNINI
ncbi:FUSC family protein [Anaerofustis stercorihominis]|nr:FUSC family protein [Anaerofustis stercorihominis]